MLPGRGTRPMKCPDYRVPFANQLKSGGASGAFDCTAWAASRVIAASTCGHTVPSGRVIRLKSSEPRPQGSSPGLNLIQVADVAIEFYGVDLDVRVGSRSLDWNQYEDLREQGFPMVIQGNYAVIADTKFDGGRGFRGGHAIAETQHSTLDSLANPENDPNYRRGAWTYDARLYPRELMREFAGKLDTGGGRAGMGKVWCAVGRDTAPDKYAVTIKPRRDRKHRVYRDFRIQSGQIAQPPYRTRETEGFTANCSIPRWFRHQDGRYRSLVEITDKDHPQKVGQMVARHWVHER